MQSARIDDYVTHWNEDSEPFERTATVDSILEKVEILNWDSIRACLSRDGYASAARSSIRTSRPAAAKSYALCKRIYSVR